MHQYLKLSGQERSSLKPVSTPYVAEGGGGGPARSPVQSGPSIECPHCKHAFPAAGVSCSEVHESRTSDRQPSPAYAGAAPCVLGPCALAPAAVGLTREMLDENGIVVKGRCHLRKGAKPKVEQVTYRPGQVEEGGQLQPIAARVLMKILYAERMCRFDLLRAVCSCGAGHEMGFDL